MTKKAVDLYSPFPRVFKLAFSRSINICQTVHDGATVDMKHELENIDLPLGLRYSCYLYVLPDQTLPKFKRFEKDAN